jgi:hypothetical protein
MNGEPRAERWQFLEWVVAVTIAGYVVIGRNFAHIGVKPFYIGEIVFGLFLVARGTRTFGPFVRALLRPTLWSPLAWLIYASVLFGMFETFRGLSVGHHQLITVQNMAFHIYPLFVFVGYCVGAAHPDYLHRIISPLGWLNGIYGVLYLFVFAPLGLTPKLNLYEHGMFTPPVWTGVLMTALLCYEPKMNPWWRGFGPLVLNGFVLIGMQTRSEWLSLIVCLPVWGLLAGRTSHVVRFSAAVTLLLLVGWISDIRIPSPESRGGEISTREVVARAVAAASPKLAAQISRDADFYTGTISWRTGWWKELWTMVHASPERAAIGPGYGFPIWDFHPEGLDDFPLRTPHNAIIYALAYTGWIGVLFFVALQLMLAVYLWDAWRASGQPFGLCMWIMCLVRSSFDVFFESPQYAIVYYILIGLVLAEAPSHATHASQEATA